MTLTIRNSGPALVLTLAGSVGVALSGCRHFDPPGSPETESRSDSGAVTISKMGGGIDIADAPNGANLTTMGGDIHLGNVATFAKLKTMGGNIAIDHADGSVDATTMGGKITVDRVNGALKATTMAGDITARMVGTSAERRDIDLSSMAGTITLLVPKDFPMEVRVTIDYTKNATRAYEIVDHIGLSRSETAEWDNSKGTPRKYLRATGRVGSGLNHVTIETVNGDVILKQE